MPNKNNLNKTNTKHLLFFSELCSHSKELLTNLKQKNLLDKVQLICIDNRYIENNIGISTITLGSPEYNELRETILNELREIEDNIVKYQKQLDNLNFIKFELPRLLDHS